MGHTGPMARLAVVVQFVAKSAWRVGVVVVGAALLLGGLVMMVTPGPGLLLIVAGLAVLASEFAWAEAMLERARRAASKATDAVRRRPPPAGDAPPPAQDPPAGDTPPPAQRP